LHADPRFANPTDRAEHQVALRDILEAIFAEHDSHAWLERFRQAGVPCAPINDYSEVLADPPVEHMDWVQDLELPNGVRTRTFVSPVRFDARTAGVMRRPPALGEHNDEILSALAARPAG
ncbi:CoA transferase, partial [Bordetella pertussis]